MFTPHARRKLNELQYTMKTNNSIILVTRTASVISLINSANNKRNTILKAAMKAKWETMIGL